MCLHCYMTSAHFQNRKKRTNIAYRVHKYTLKQTNEVAEDQIVYIEKRKSNGKCERNRKQKCTAKKLEIKIESKLMSANITQCVGIAVGRDLSSIEMLANCNLCDVHIFNLGKVVL